MSREAHVRFCERPGVKIPRATHPVLVFETEQDARGVLAVLPKRFGKYGLRLHPEKTRLMRFSRPRYGSSRKDDESSCGNRTIVNAQIGAS